MLLFKNFRVHKGYKRESQQVSSGPHTGAEGAADKVEYMWEGLCALRNGTGRGAFGVPLMSTCRMIHVITNRQHTCRRFLPSCDTKTEGQALEVKYE